MRINALTHFKLMGNYYDGFLHTRSSFNHIKQFHAVIKFDFQNKCLQFNIFDMGYIFNSDYLGTYLK